MEEGEGPRASEHPAGIQSREVPSQVSGALPWLTPDLLCHLTTPLGLGDAKSSLWETPWFGNHSPGFYREL